MALCTLPADLVLKGDVAYGKHKQLQHSIPQMLLVKHASLTTCTAELIRTDPSVSRSATDFRKRSTELLSEITLSALHRPLTA